MSGAFDALSIGNLARILAGISEEDLHRAVEYQQTHPRTKMGEILVKLRIVSSDNVDTLLRKQEDLRCGKVSESDLKLIVDFAAERTELGGDQMADVVREVRKRLR